MRLLITLLRIIRVFVIAALLVPLMVMSSEHGGDPAASREHGGEPAAYKKQGAETATAKEHGGTQVESES